MIVNIKSDEVPQFGYFLPFIEKNRMIAIKKALSSSIRKNATVPLERMKQIH